jgi:IMP dehydrogenase/GMP reductase
MVHHSKKQNHNFVIMSSIPITTQLLACATCRGDINSASTMAQDGAVGFMLLLLAAVLGTFVLIMFGFAKKQRIALQELGEV